MQSPKEHRPWVLRLAAIKERLQEPLWWLPYPFLLPFALTTILTTHVLSASNPRMGNPADVIPFPAPSQKDSAIWISVTPLANEIVVTTNDRQVFRWPLRMETTAAVKPLITYLKKRAQQEIQAAALMKRALVVQTTAVIAADQRLKYLHIRPIIYALSQAGITNYAFETRSPIAFRQTQDGEGASRE